MRISRKTDYALRVLFTLVERRAQGPISMAELAHTNDVPKRFLEHIMLDLKKEGWVASTLGRNGGYVLAMPPEEITMGQVVRCFDSSLAPVGGLSVSGDESNGTRSSTYRFRRVLLEVRNMTEKYMDNATLARLCAADPVQDDKTISPEVADGEGI
jgi:Rrf2 family protein